MAMIPMTSGFSVCPEGVHVFRIYDVEYNEEFGKLVISLVNAQGITHKERYSLINQSGEMNEGACNAFSFFAKTALNDYSLESVDPATLIDKYIKAKVTHTVQPNRNDPNKNVTFVNLGEKWVADGFDTQPVPKALTLGKDIKTTPVEQPAATGLDINALLKG